MSTRDHPQEISGTMAEAEGWVSSSALPEHQKRELHRFIRRFPTLRFYKQAQAQGGARWMREIRTTLEGVIPDGLCWFHFDCFESELYNEDMLDLWHHRLSFDADLSSEYDQVLMDGKPLLFVAAVIEHLDSLFAVKGSDEADDAVYGLSYRSIQHAGGKTGYVSPDDAQVVFHSYTSMLNHIDAVKLQGERIVEAYREEAAH